MRVLVVTRIFPNRVEPHANPFNRLQLEALSRLADLEILATIPWFPAARWFRRWSRAGRLGDVPSRDRIGQLDVQHPRVAYLPLVGSGVSGPLYAASLAARVLPYHHRVDIVLGSWAYPDGFAAVALAEMLGVPAVVKLHGSDINVVARMPAARARVEKTLAHADRIVAVSRPLADQAAELGASRERIDVVRNGVDTGLFRPRDRQQARDTLGLPRGKPMALYLGRVEREKGALDLIDAWGRSGASPDEAMLAVVGDGAALDACKRLADQHGLAVHFAGARPHEEVADWLAACDVLTLPSWNEGTPNAVLEAVASGRRVVATRVGGIPDVIDSDVLGTLVPARDTTALASALRRALSRSYDPAAVAATANIPDWDHSARMLHASLLATLGTCAREAA